MKKYKTLLLFFIVLCSALFACGSIFISKKANAGGGIFIAGDANVNISGGSLHKNDKAIVFEKGDHVLEDVTISGSTNGALYFAGGGTLTLINCVIENNENDDNGGAINLGVDSTLVVNNSIIRNNTTNGKGGAIFAATGAKVEVVNNSIISNNQAYLGGGVYLSENAILNDGLSGIEYFSQNNTELDGAWDNVYYEYVSMNAEIADTETIYSNVKVNTTIGEVVGYDQLKSTHLWYSEKENFSEYLGSAPTFGQIGMQEGVNNIAIPIYGLSKVQYLSVDGNDGIVADNTDISGVVIVPQIVRGATINIVSGFGNCLEITEVVMPMTVNTIDFQAFDNCPKLEKITTPESKAFEVLGEAFRESGIKEIAATGVVGELAFYSCKKLEKVELINATTIKQEAFASCSLLKSINLEDVCAIDARAFSGCVSLTKIDISKTVGGLGYRAFNGCTSLNEVIVSNPQDWDRNFADIFYGCSNLKLTTSKIFLDSNGASEFINNTMISEIVLLESVSSIPTNAFSGATQLTKITIPNSVTSIGTNAFKNAPIAELNIDMTNVPASFAQSKTLKKVIIGSNVEKVLSHAFNVCEALLEIDMTNASSLKMIEEAGFANCYQLKNVYFGENCPVEEFGNLSFYCDYNVKSYNLSMLKNLKTITAAFNSNYALTNIILPDSLEILGNGTFKNCNNLTEIVLPSLVSGIGSDAFYGCSALTGVYVDSVDQFLNFTFATATSNPIYYAKNLYVKNQSGDGYVLLENLEINKAVGSYQFINATCLKSVKIGSVGSIGANAFADCTNIESVNVDNVSNFRMISFANEMSNPLKYASRFLENGIEIDTLTLYLGFVGKYAFINAGWLKNIIICDRFGEFYDTSFSGLSNITLTLQSVPSNVDILLGVTQKLVLEVENVDAFIGSNSSIKIVEIGESVKSIASSTFASCGKIEKVVVRDINSFASINFGNAPANPLYYGNYLYDVNGSMITEIMLDTDVSAYAFYDAKSLEKVTLTSNVTRVGAGAFTACSNLAIKGLHITDLAAYAAINFTDVSASPITNAKNLYLNGTLVESLNFERVTDIARYAFYKYEHLKTITIDDNIKTIATYAFEGVSFDSVTFEKNLVTSGFQYSTINKLIFNYNHIAYEGQFTTTIKNLNVTDKTIVIGNKVSSIADDAFSAIDTYKSLDMSNAKTTLILGNRTFANMYALESVSFPVGYNGTMGTHLFYGCKKLTNINLHETAITIVPQSMFHDCYDATNLTGLTSIELPNTVREIRTNAFYSCRILESIKFASGTILSSVGDMAFDSCKLLSSITVGDDSSVNTLPYGLTTLPYGLFYGCSALESFTIPESVETFGQKVFKKCTALKSLLIPDSVSFIGGESFQGCTNLKLIYFSSSVIEIEVEYDEEYDFYERPFLGCSSDLIIYLEASSIPEGWPDNWDEYNEDDDTLVYQENINIYFNKTEDDFYAKQATI